MCVAVQWSACANVRGSQFKVQQMAIGSKHCLLLSQEGRVYAMGENSKFQLGLPGPDEVRLVPTLVYPPEEVGDAVVGSLLTPASRGSSSSGVGTAACSQCACRGVC